MTKQTNDASMSEYDRLITRMTGIVEEVGLVRAVILLADAMVKVSDGSRPPAQTRLLRVARQLRNLDCG